MRSKSHGSLNLFKYGPLPTLALVAATMAPVPAAQAQVRTRAPVATPTPATAETINTRRLRRSPVTETSTPAPSAVYVQEAQQTTPTPEPSEERAARSRRTRDDQARTRASRDPVEGAPPSREPNPVRVRRTPIDDTARDERLESTPVRARRIPVEATPPEREPTPVRTRRTPSEDTVQDAPSETTPVRVRRVPVEATPREQRDPTPVRTRRTPTNETPFADTPTTRTETNPVRVRRVPVEATPPPREPTPVRARRLPIEEVPLVTPVRVRPDITPVRRPPAGEQVMLDAPLPNEPGRRHCGGALTPQPLMARIRQDTLQDATIASILPPPDTAVSSLTDTLTLRTGSHADVMRTLPALRQIPMSVLQGNSILAVGKTRVDFKPMVQNPTALINIAKKLRALPDQVEICADLLEAMEVKQGLVVRSLMTYRILPGACRNEERRKKLATSGVNCFTRQTAAQREAGFSLPRDARFVRNSRDRATAIAASRIQAAKIDADISKSVADFRSQLGNSAQRAAIAAEISESEVTRLEGLDDVSLAGELANAAETKIEQVAFIPNLDNAKNTLRTFKPLGVPIDAIKPPEGPPDIDYDIGDHVFLTGFTLGRQYEWKQRVETTIKWCLVGCKKTYYAELFAGFEYGFGLRFPIRFGGTYNPKSDTKGRARLTVKMAPINGSVADYKASGLANDKLFDGKEIVAEIWAHAGASAKLPLVGVLGPVDLKIGKDFTEGLPKEIVNGQFTPPTPGDPSTNIEMEKVFDDFDLIGGRANFGVLGGQLFPAVKITLDSKKMGLTLVDKIDNVNVALTPTSPPLELGVDEKDGNASRFTVKDPFYNLTFSVTPGINARLFIDLAVWGTHWDWPIWFPQLAVELPPGGVDFTCHEGTVCSKDFRYNYAGTQTEFEGALEKWAREFDPRWAPKCADEPCKLGIGFIRQNGLYSGRHQFAANPAITIAEMKDEFATADANAKAVVSESAGRKAGAASNSWGVIAQAIWTKQCKDQLCYEEVTKLAAEMGPRGRQLGKAYPDQGSLWVSQQVNKEYVPKFQKAVDESKARDAMEQSFEMQRQLQKQKVTMPKPK